MADGGGEARLRELFRTCRVLARGRARAVIAGAGDESSPSACGRCSRRTRARHGGRARTPPGAGARRPPPHRPLRAAARARQRRHGHGRARAPDRADRAARRA
jgi:hypothetical protein